MSASPPIVRLIEVRRAFGDVRAVDGVSLDIGDGEFFCLVGPSGSGKTTCLRLIAGFDRPTAGRVELQGKDVTLVPPYERDVNTVFQDYALFPHMTVAENVGYGLRIRKVAPAERARRVDEALALVRLPDLGTRKPSQLSGGQRQRVALARALVNRPRVLLLDEPLGALDLKLRQEMQVELKAIQARVGITFIFVTHDQEEALAMSDRLAVFNRGRIEQVGTPAEVYERPATRFVAAFLGTSNLFEGAVAQALTGTARAFSVRPERITLSGESALSQPGSVTCHGVVREVTYLGMFSRVVVDLDTGGSATVVEQNRGGSSVPASRGARKTVTWAREDMHVLPEEG